MQRDIKKEEQPQTSECDIIEVVDLTEQAKKDVGRTLAEMQAHVSLKFTCTIHCKFSHC